MHSFGISVYDVTVVSLNNTVMTAFDTFKLITFASFWRVAVSAWKGQSKLSVTKPRPQAACLKRRDPLK